MVQVTVNINGKGMPYKEAKEVYEQLKEIFHKPAAINWPIDDYKKWSYYFTDDKPYWKVIPEIGDYNTGSYTQWQQTI
ncbi:hypothetical protein KA005_68530 [bacterium]|nr:hypothetical protein [bacterium]